MPSSLNVELSIQARIDVADILQHTLMMWGEAQRDRYGDDIGAAFQRLATYSLSGAELENSNEHYRWRNVREHVIYYLVSDETIYVVRVLHHKMSIAGKL